MSDFSFTSVGLSAATGAKGVGIGNGLTKLTKVGKLAVLTSKSKTTAKAIETTANVTGDAISSAVGSLTQGNDVTMEGVAADVIGGRVGRGIAKNVKQAAQGSSKAKVLRNQASTAKRKAGNNPRPNRAAKAAKAENKATTFGNSRAAAAGGASSNATSKTVTTVTNTVKKEQEQNIPQN